MNYLKHIAVLLVFFLLAFGNYAQSDTTIEVIEAVGKGVRKVTPTKKQTLVPRLIEDTTKTQIKSKYLFYEYKANSDMKLQPISPAKLKIVAPLDWLKRGYIKGGIGMYTSPLLEVYYNSLRSKTHNWGVNGRHFSSNSSLDKTGFSGLSNNRLGGFYQHFFKDFYLKGEANYNRNTSHFYGFNSEDTLIDKNTIKQFFNTIGGKLSMSSFHKDSGELNYRGSLEYINYSDINNTKENTVILDFNADKMISSEVFGVDFGVDFNSYKSSDMQRLDSTGDFTPPSNTINNTILKVIPNITTSGDKWYVKVGLAIYADIQDESKFYFYPNVEAKYSFFDIFVPYVGVNGGLKRNSYRTLTTENPFLLSQVNLNNTNVRYNLYAGVRGSITNSVSFNLQVARKSIRDQALFFNDTTYSIGNKMDVVYDSLDVTELNGQITFQETEKLRVFLKGKYSFWSPLHQEYVWNNPDLEVTLGGVYDLADKILVRADVFFVGPRKAKSLRYEEGAELNKDNTYSINQKSFFDFNLGFEYRFNKNISAYVNFNNIIGKRYQLFYNYPVQGINILGGATYRF